MTWLTASATIEMTATCSRMPVRFGPVMKAGVKRETATAIATRKTSGGISGRPASVLRPANRATSPGSSSAGWEMLRSMAELRAGRGGAHRACRELVPCEGADQAPLMHDDDAVGHRQHLVHLR